MKKNTQKRKMLVGNWKMNPRTLEEAKKIFSGIKRAAVKTKGVEVVVCPPFPFVGLMTKSTPVISLGAQNMFWEEVGSFTGEVGASMLTSLGCSYVILGHSERRALAETNDVVSKKVITALENSLVPIVCVGESERDTQGDYLGFLKQQITESLKGVTKKNIGKVVVAYEPVWAIGKSYNTAVTGKDMQEMSIFIQKVLADIFGKDETASVRILYGGSVAPVNAEDIALHGDIDGFLVGRQSLEAGFGEIMSMLSRA